jgi:hypothetical protein
VSLKKCADNAEIPPFKHREPRGIENCEGINNAETPEEKRENSEQISLLGHFDA